MSKHTPTFIFSSIVEACGLLLFVFMARREDGSLNVPIAAFAGFLLLCGTAIAVVTALKMATEKRQG